MLHIQQLYVVQNQGQRMTSKHIGVELRSLNNAIVRFMSRFANKKYIDKMTNRNGWIIGYLARHQDQDVFQRDLEQEFGITRSTASRVINLMVKKGLIEHCPVENDARLKKLVLTPKALEISVLMQADGKQMEDKLSAGFSPEELETFFSFIERMKQNIANE
jgi:DNA-binding MarR family transcriptional regulator